LAQRNKLQAQKASAATDAAAAAAGAYHLLTMVRVITPHLSCVNLFITTEATTLIVTYKPLKSSE
jgi:hypothetical protein